MKKTKTFTFTAKIKASEIGSGGAYVEFPHDVEEAFGKKGRIKVRCLFESIEYRGSLVRMGTNCHIIGISKDIRNALGKQIGDTVTVHITEDTEERTVEIPEILKKELDKNKKRMERYQSLSFSKKKEIAQSLQSAKKEETRKGRLDRIIQELNPR